MTSAGLWMMSLMTSAIIQLYLIRIGVVFAPIESILSPRIFEDFSPFQNNFTALFFNFDSFVSQIHTPIFVNFYFPTKFSYNLPKLANFKTYFLNHLSSFSLLTVEGQANFYPPWGKVETVGNVMNWVKWSKVIIDIFTILV